MAARPGRGMAGRARGAAPGRTPATGRAARHAGVQQGAGGGPPVGDGKPADSPDWTEVLREDRRPARPLPRTKFRRKKGAPTRAEREAGAARLGAAAEGGGLHVPWVKEFDRTQEPVLFVDGYNVCGAWEPARALFLAVPPRLAEARARLLQELEWFFGARLVVVFDAGQNRKGEEQEDLHERGVRVVFAHDADEWMDSAVAGLMQQDRPPKTTLVTNDVMSRELARGSGALVMGSEVFMEKVQACKTETLQRLEEIHEREKRASQLAYALPDDDFDGVMGLRNRLVRAEMAQGRAAWPAEEELGQQREGEQKEGEQEEGEQKEQRKERRKEKRQPRKKDGGEAKLSAQLGHGALGSLLEMREALSEAAAPTEGGAPAEVEGPGGTAALAAMIRGSEAPEMAPVPKSGPRGGKAKARRNGRRAAGRGGGAGARRQGQRRRDRNTKTEGRKE